MFLVVLSQKEIHDRACQMTQSKQHGKHHGKEIFPVPGECKKAAQGNRHSDRISAGLVFPL